MRKIKLFSIGKRAFSALLAFCLSLMMVPAVAFADIGGDSYEVEVNATEGDASHTTGEDVSATEKLAVGVVADNGHTAETVVGNVTSSYGGKQAVMVDADNGGTANVSTGNVTQNRGNFGVVANADNGGKAVVETGDVSVTTNYYSSKNAAVEASAKGSDSSVQITSGNVTGAPRCGNGIDANTMGGTVEITAGDVKGYEVGLNIDNAPSGEAAGYTGEKRVTVDSVTQTKDSRYSAAGINAFSYTNGDVNTVQVKGNVNAAGSRGIDVKAIGGSETSVTVGGEVNANYLGVKIEAGSLGNVHGTTVSTGTAIVHVGCVVAKKWDKAVEIDSNTKGSTVTFQSDGDVKALDSDSTGIFARSVGGKSAIIVDGNLSGKQAGLYIYCDEVGSNDVLVTGTISGKNGVDISYDSVANDTLTVWKIEKASNGKYISSEWNNVPSDDRETFAKKRIKYIVKVAESTGLTEGNLRAAKDANGTELDTSHGYSVAKEGPKVYLVVDPGYEIISASNGNENQVIQQDANGNYYIVVKRGGGIDLMATVSFLDDIAIVPEVEDIVTGASVSAESVPDNAAVSSSLLPYLTSDGVMIEDVSLEIKAKKPNLSVRLSNENASGVEFDCTKFKVVSVANDEEVGFKTKPQKLKPNESSAKFSYSAEEGALQTGERAYVYYADQLLGTFTVK